MAPRIHRRAASGAAIAALALLAATIVACTDDGMHAARVTTPPDRVGRAAVQSGADPVVVLPQPPVRGRPEFVGEHDEDLVVFGGALRTHSGLDVLQDAVAVLDEDTFAWTVLPGPPFDHPTADPAVAISGDDLVLVGADCDPSRPGIGSSGPACRTGAVRSARLDLATGRWQRLPNPPGAGSGDIVQAWSASGGVLVAVTRAIPVGVPGAPPVTIPAGAIQPDRTQVGWSYLPDGAAAWESVPPAPIRATIRCGAQRTVAVIAVDSTWDGVTWSPASAGGGSPSQSYGRVRATFFDGATRTWTAPSAPAVEHATGAVGGGCVPGGVVWAAAAGVWWASNGVVQPTDDQAVWVLRQGSADWERHPWDPPPADPGDPGGSAAIGPFILSAVPLPVVLDPTGVVFESPDRQHAVTWDLASGRWDHFPADQVQPDALVDAAVLGRTVAARFEAPYLVAVAR